MSERDEQALNAGTVPDTSAAPEADEVLTTTAEASAPPVGEAVVVTEPETTSEATASQAPAGETVIESVAVVPAGSAPAAAEAPRRSKAHPVKPSTLQPLPPYAIIETGGKQYRVSVGDVVSVEKLPVEAGSTITFDRVLLVNGDGETRVGTPTVAGASVAATVEETYRGEKLIIFKMKAKKGYRRKTGHRQSLTRLAITAINA
ncbi:MAG: LSU ribosomal protein L21p [uncultured Thermomicrobiales bacterium]|uniref:Large ribosomal subunit protein bL21 n=1 Tax=uncultured Thermomicrobiales bacterium TaxID=1645740 RepID=A0A6J4TZG6_9BACT|nr:MAG: LSU ribosomal protein L21p [uncultured Thermomicrobiales bacterium]